MIVALPVRRLMRRRSRTALALAGIAVSAGLLVDMTMLASGLTRSFGELTRAQGYALRVTPRGTLPFDSEAGIPGAGELGRRIAAVEGVRSVAPILGAQLYPVGPEGVGEPVFTNGIDPAAQMLYLLMSGRDPGPGEVVISRGLVDAEAWEVGDTVSLAGELDPAIGTPRNARAYVVSGIGDFIYDYSGQRSAAVDLSEVEALTGRVDEVSLWAVSIEEGVDEDSAADRVAALDERISVYSTRELMDAMDQRLAYFRQLSTILGTIAIGVAALLVGTIVTIGVRERFGEIATLRAIGVSARRLQLGIVAEGSALTLAGCALGAPLGWLMALRLDRILLQFPGIPSRVSFFVFDPIPVAAALSAIVLIGAVAGVIPGMRALRAPLGGALREEAD